MMLKIMPNTDKQLKRNISTVSRPDKSAAVNILSSRNENSKQKIRRELNEHLFISKPQ